MNKAFTKETDADTDDDLVSQPLPVGGKNYITPQGYARLRSELLELIDTERPKIVEIVHWAASNGDRSENGDYLYGKKRLREIDRRIRFLTKRLEIAEIVEPAIHHGSDQVFFGATVTYLEDDSVERTITILGIDEAESGHGQVSWMSPVARALLKSRVGDEISLAAPGGMHRLEVMDVQYPDKPWQSGVCTGHLHLAGPTVQAWGMIRDALITACVRRNPRNADSRWA